MSSTQDEVLLGIATAMADLDHPTKVATAQWAQEHLVHDDLIDADAESRFSFDDWRRCAEHGLLAMNVPIEYGGTGDDLADVLLKLEGLGYGCRDNGLGFALASQILSTQLALVRFGTDEQRERGCSRPEWRMMHVATRGAILRWDRLAPDHRFRHDRVFVLGET